MWIQGAKYELKTETKSFARKTQKLNCWKKDRLLKISSSLNGLLSLSQKKLNLLKIILILSENN